MASSLPARGGLALVPFSGHLPPAPSAPLAYHTCLPPTSHPRLSPPLHLCQPAPAWRLHSWPRQMEVLHPVRMPYASPFCCSCQCVGTAAAMGCRWVQWVPVEFPASVPHGGGLLDLMSVLHPFLLLVHLGMMAFGPHLSLRTQGLILALPTLRSQTLSSVNWGGI